MIATRYKDYKNAVSVSVLKHLLSGDEDRKIEPHYNSQ